MVARIAVLTALVGALSAFASPVKRSGACPDATPDFVDGISCPPLQLLSGFLNFQGDSVGQSATNVLASANELLLSSSSDPASDIVSDVTGGIVNGLTNGVVFSLKGLAATVPQLNPDCACNMVACNSALQDAIAQSNLDSSLTNQSCGQAIYSCAAFYSREEINKVAPACADYEFGATSD